VSRPPARFGRRRVYLMRHGHVDYFSDKVLAAGDHRVATLTALGRAQAEAAGLALKEAPIDLALCSGYPRTRETADIVLGARADRLDLGDDEAFVELKGGTLKFPSRDVAAEAMHAQFLAAAQSGARMFGGEAFNEAQARAVEALTALLVGPIWQSALVVAHEGINRLILSWACGAGLSAAPAFEQDTACVNVLDFDIAPDANGAPSIARAIVKLINATPYNWLKHGMSRTSLEAIFAAD
jgi:probable phosphoglycerate mutase